MKLDCVSDLHGYFPDLKGGDILIIAGDCTTNNSVSAWNLFFLWLKDQDYKHKVVVGGNHDTFLANGMPTNKLQQQHCKGICAQEGIADCFEYLCDYGINIAGLKIWGSPWSKSFASINPRCAAFTCAGDAELFDKCAMIPDDTDILITHAPPYGILDIAHGEHLGDISLRAALHRVKPRYHIFWHIHECAGRSQQFDKTMCCNVGLLNGQYEIAHRIRRIEIN